MTQQSRDASQEEAVLAALTSLVGKHRRPVWAHEVATALFRELGHGGLDGRWVTPMLLRLAEQGRVIRVRRWATDLSRWTVPDQKPKQ